MEPQQGSEEQVEDQLEHFDCTAPVGLSLSHTLDIAFGQEALLMMSQVEKFDAHAALIEDWYRHQSELWPYLQRELLYILLAVQANPV